MTSLFDASIRDERNPRRFVDAVSIPYVVLPPEGFKHAKLADFATVVNVKNGKVAGAIVADQSAPDLPNEGSEEYKTISAELQSALSRQIGEIRKRLKTYPLPKERRSIEG